MEAFAAPNSINEIGSDAPLPVMIDLVGTDRLRIKEIILADVELFQCRLNLIGNHRASGCIWKVLVNKGDNAVRPINDVADTIGRDTPLVQYDRLDILHGGIECRYCDG